MHNFQANYNKILEVLNLLDIPSNYLFQIRKPKLSDKELMAINLTSEYMRIDSECQVFRVLPKELKTKIERSVYNRRKHKLFEFQETICQKLNAHFLEFEYCFIIDSMPLELCKLSRDSRSTICKSDFETSPDKGYCASQSSRYYGYKLHAVCSVNRIISSFDISKEYVHDIHYLKDIKNQMNDCVLLADKGYLSTDYQLDLFEKLI